MNKPIVGFAGMTHLGINSLVAAAERGFHVVGFDTNMMAINRLKNQDPPVVEPQLIELMVKNTKQITFTAENNDLAQCDIVYIAADVPTNDKGQSELTVIRQLIDNVVNVLAKNAILVILCQVPPGFTRALSFPKERLFYQVETLVFGQAIDRALNPERFMVGFAIPEQSLPPSYHTLLSAFQCPILPMRYESAELAKISINFCLVASISVANTLSEVCEKIGADWSEIAPALKLDKRIGPFAYLAPGLGIAGGNLERDLTTILELSREHGTESGIVSAWIKNSQYRRDWVLRSLHQELLAKNDNPTIAVLGLAYKENTDSIKNSPSLALLSALTAYRVKVYDPVVPASVAAKAEGTLNAADAVQGADALIIMTPWAEFKELTLTILQKMKGRLIVDPFRILKGHEIKKAGFHYLTLGKSSVC